MKKKNLKEDFKLKLKRTFKELKTDFDVILFRNPKEFVWLNLEFVNPNHKVLVYGLPKSRIKPRNYVLMGKLFLKGFVPIFSVMLCKAFYVDLTACIMFSYLFFALLVWCIDNEKRLEKVCLSVSRENLAVAKPF